MSKFLSSAYVGEMFLSLLVRILLVCPLFYEITRHHTSDRSPAANNLNELATDTPEPAVFRASADREPAIVLAVLTAHPDVDVSCSHPE